MQAELRRITLMVLSTALLFTMVLGAIANATLRRQQLWQAMRDEHRHRIEAGREQLAQRKARAERWRRGPSAGD